MGNEIEPLTYVKVVRKDGLEVSGLVLPLARSDDTIVIKLDNGYNIGIKKENIERIEVLGKYEKKVSHRESKRVERRPGFPLVKIIGTGGTIASKIDYETGAVKPYLSANELIEDIPEIKEIADLETEQLLDILSENMKPKNWERIALEVHKELLRDDVKGIIVAHGTDTMSYTAAAISFAIQELNKPVVFVGAQRSSDRPSSDAAFNLLAATLVAARAPFAEVVITMHGETGDTYAVVHRATRTRKMHSTRRDAFKSICSKPIALVWPWIYELKVIEKDLRKRSNSIPRLLNKFDERAFLVKMFPGMKSDIFDIIKERGYKGIIIEGTGMGHISEDLLSTIRNLIKDGIFVGMTTQCIYGTTNLNVYATGRKLLEVGVTPLGDMLSETALVKLMWVLGNFGDDIEVVKRKMLEPIAGEISSRRTLDLF
nr:Glu-tRNA(Gln) amidotransferase subunit GatD [Ignicoccus islandicus]